MTKVNSHVIIIIQKLKLKLPINGFHPVIRVCVENYRSVIWNVKSKVVEYMGYDMKIVVLKKKTLNYVREMFPNYTFSEMYSSFLIDYLYPEEYIIPEDEVGREIVWSNKDIFSDFFERKLKNDEAIVIDEDTYTKMIDWLEDKMKSKTLYDLAIDEKNNMCELEEMIRAYRNMKTEKIDYETEFVVYSHDW